jgi:hypothetical protein
VRYKEWRGAIADFVARRVGRSSEELVAQLAAQVSLAIALTAYEQWLRCPEASLSGLLDAEMPALLLYLTP